MKRFNGFPAKTEFTPLPNAFFSSILPQISDITELKITLHVMAIIYRKKGYPRFITLGELLGNVSVMTSLKVTEESPDILLRNALKKAVTRGTLLLLTLDGESGSEDFYFLNDESGRQAVTRINNGELELNGLKVRETPYVETKETSDIFTLYEQNIHILTPLIADELKEAERIYPQNWIVDAIKEAVTQNKRKWSYISAILDSWAAEGKTDGTYQRHPKKTDPDKYVKGKYGHMVRR